MIERYTRPEMGAMWAEQKHLDTWMETELAICGAWANIGHTPKYSFARIHKSASVNPQLVREIEEITRHGLIAFLTALVERVIMPDSIILAGYIAQCLKNLLAGLRVVPENMARNLMDSYGLFFRNAYSSP